MRRAPSKKEAAGGTAASRTAKSKDAPGSRRSATIGITADVTQAIYRTLADLADERVWVAWHPEPNDKGRITKVPKNPATGGNAQVPTNPRTYGTRAAAERRWQKFKADEGGEGGTGVVLCELPNGQHLVGLDLDGCIEDDTVTDYAWDIIERFDSYAEVSPSGNGVKQFFLMSAADLAKLLKLIGNNAKGEQLTSKSWSAGTHREAVIHTARFFAVTEQKLKDSPETLRLVPFEDVEWFVTTAAPNYKAQQQKQKPQGNGHDQDKNHAEAYGDEQRERDKSGSGYGYRFMQDCHAQGMDYDAAHEAILADENDAGEWANRVDARQLQRAWENSKPKEDDDERSVKGKLLQSSSEFVGGFVPPDYLIDGLLQRRFVYSFTGPTGSGKTCIVLRIAAHVDLGLLLGGKEVEQGRVLFFAGENPDDVRTRWIKLCEEMGLDPDNMGVFFVAGVLPLSNKKIREQIDAEAAEHGPFSLIIIDTSAAYFEGDDENSNVQLGNHARLIRSFVNLPGGPTVIVTCHPIKNFDADNLLPRGGGAFLNEVDGNLACVKDTDSMVVEVTTHGKFRGPEFAPFSFELTRGFSPKLIDSKGRSISSVTATPLTGEEQAEIESEGHDQQDDLLRAMLRHPGASLSDMGNYMTPTAEGAPNKQKVFRMMKSLAKEKLVEKRRGSYVLTPKGVKEAEAISVVVKVKTTTKTEHEVFNKEVPKGTTCAHCGETGVLKFFVLAKNKVGKVTASTALHVKCAESYFQDEPETSTADAMREED